MEDRALNYLGLARRAGQCAAGETDCGSTCRAGRAKVLVLARDASDNARRRAESFVYGRGIPLITAPWTKAELGAALGRGSTAMAAVTDLGLAEAMTRTLADMGNEEELTAAARRLSEQLAARKRRQAEQQAADQNKRFGKRRNQA